MAYSALFNNAFEALILLLIIFFMLTEQKFSYLAPLQNTEFLIEFCAMSGKCIGLVKLMYWSCYVTFILEKNVIMNVASVL